MQEENLSYVDHTLRVCFLFAQYDIHAKSHY